MFPVRFRVIGLLAAAAIAAGACSSGATASPAASATPPASQSAAASSAAPSASGSESAPASASAAAIPTIPADQLIKAGTLTVCSDTSYPPQESLDPTSHVATGSDIDLAKEIAKRLGLQLAVKSTVFDSIIPSLQGGNCDIIVSAQTITEKRKEAVDMIPYFEAGQSFVVLTGNPEGIKAITDICGKAVAVEKGTVEADNLTGGGDYAGAGIAKTCKDAGKAAPTAKVFGADTDALLALQSHTVVAHFTDEPVAGNEVKKGNGAFEMVPGITLEHAPEGISVLKNKTAISASVKAALQSMIADGTYLQILTKWGVESGKLTTPLQ